MSRDGSVYLEAEGREDALSEILAWSKKGPPRAKVEEVVFTESTVENFILFEILR